MIMQEMYILTSVIDIQKENWGWTVTPNFLFGYQEYLLRSPFSR